MSTSREAMNSQVGGRGEKSAPTLNIWPEVPMAGRMDGWRMFCETYLSREWQGGGLADSVRIKKLKKITRKTILI